MSKYIKFDHFEFPGVVPRTFVGIVPISLVAAPIVKFTGVDKIAALTIVRGILCCAVWYSLIRFKNALCSRFRYESLGFWFMAFCSTQFHLCFYMSRTLPNTFGLILVLWAFESDLRNRWRTCSACLAISTLIFRCDTLLLAAPIGLKILISKQATLFEFVSHALLLFISCLVLTVCVDSYFWNRLLWPEGVVLYFNTILNKSHEWGMFDSLESNSCTFSPLTLFFCFVFRYTTHVLVFHKCISTRTSHCIAHVRSWSVSCLSRFSSSYSRNRSRYLVLSSSCNCICVAIFDSSSQGTSFRHARVSCLYCCRCCGYVCHFTLSLVSLSLSLSLSETHIHNNNK